MERKSSSGSGSRSRGIDSGRLVSYDSCKFPHIGARATCNTKCRRMTSTSNERPSISVQCWRHYMSEAGVSQYTGTHQIAVTQRSSPLLPVHKHAARTLAGHKEGGSDSDKKHVVEDVAVLKSEVASGIRACRAMGAWSHPVPRHPFTSLVGRRVLSHILQLRCSDKDVVTRAEFDHDSV
jgi:hypothetical protein